MKKLLILVLIQWVVAGCAGGNGDHFSEGDADSSGPECIRDCEERECGDNGCGGLCGLCSVDWVCNNVGLCIESPPGDWRRIPAGTFIMGSPPDEEGRSSDETQHEVTITHHYEMMSTEVTRNQFQQVMGFVPDHEDPCEGDCPIRYITWAEAAAYCNHLSDYVGLDRCYECSETDDLIECWFKSGEMYFRECNGYRLPTEAEWEYAARAGTSVAQYGDVNEIAWHFDNTGNHVTQHPVGTKLPNDWGLYDMLGNVSEWCHDYYDEYPPGPISDPFGNPPSYEQAMHVIRGGSVTEGVTEMRAANRSYTSVLRDGRIGFRPVRFIPR